ncbi:hypothetical protein QJQ45_007885 [Haematococcus lacustris]|nr:hypothetical protein QJQ45_007885 [Haematococcus lacustris]
MQVRRRRELQAAMQAATPGRQRHLRNQLQRLQRPPHRAAWMSLTPLILLTASPHLHPAFHLLTLARAKPGVSGNPLEAGLPGLLRRIASWPAWPPMAALRGLGCPADLTPELPLPVGPACGHTPVWGNPLLAMEDAQQPPAPFPQQAGAQALQWVAEWATTGFQELAAIPSLTNLSSLFHLCRVTQPAGRGGRVGSREWQRAVWGEEQVARSIAVAVRANPARCATGLFAMWARLPTGWQQEVARQAPLPAPADPQALQRVAVAMVMDRLGWLPKAPPTGRTPAPSPIPILEGATVKCFTRVLMEPVTMLRAEANARFVKDALAGMPVNAMVNKKRGVMARCAGAQKAREVMAQRRAAVAEAKAQAGAAEAEAQAQADARAYEAQLHQLQPELQQREQQATDTQRLQHLQQQLQDLQQDELQRKEQQVAEQQQQLQQQQADMHLREQQLAEQLHQLQQQQADMQHREQQVAQQQQQVQQQLAEQLHQLQQQQADLQHREQQVAQQHHQVQQQQADLQHREQQVAQQHYQVQLQQQLNRLQQQLEAQSGAELQRQVQQQLAAQQHLLQQQQADLLLKQQQVEKQPQEAAVQQAVSTNHPLPDHSTCSPQVPGSLRSPLFMRPRQDTTLAPMPRAHCAAVRNTPGLVVVSCDWSEKLTIHQDIACQGAYWKQRTMSVFVACAHYQDMAGNYREESVFVSADRCDQSAEASTTALVQVIECLLQGRRHPDGIQGEASNTDGVNTSASHRQRGHIMRRRYLVLDDARQAGVCSMPEADVERMHDKVEGCRAMHRMVFTPDREQPQWAMAACACSTCMSVPCLPCMKPDTTTPLEPMPMFQDTVKEVYDDEECYALLMWFYPDLLHDEVCFGKLTNTHCARYCQHMGLDRPKERRKLRRLVVRDLRSEQLEFEYEVNRLYG